MIISLDLGTTHSKSAVFSANGQLLNFARIPSHTYQHPAGYKYCNPEEMWAGVVSLLQQITDTIDPTEISAIGITSMAETGLLVDNVTGKPRTHLLPWHDRNSITYVPELELDREPILQFSRSGIRPTFKCSLAKLLWMRDNYPDSLENSTWLSAADYIGFRLAGMMATDYSLAGRTYAFRIDQLVWDQAWLTGLGLPAGIFPPAYPSGVPQGELSQAAASLTGLLPGIPICISGHDHVCAAFAAVGTRTDQALDSMGTAEALLGSLHQDKLGIKEFESGLVFGRHVVGDGYYWMGGMSMSGGSLDWLRKILGEPQISYTDFEQLLEKLPTGPTGIVYFPYLAGSGSPHTDIHMRGAFFGLDQSHDRYDMVKAVLEGTAFEAEYIRQAARRIKADDLELFIASGGGSNLLPWMQIKADVSGCVIEVPEFSDMTLLGAALVAGIGCGIYSGESDARSTLRDIPSTRFQPDQSCHQEYNQIYLEGFLALQASSREISTRLRSTPPSIES